MNFPKSVEVRIWGKIVGYLAKLSNGKIQFEYESTFLSSGLEVSPVEMPLRTTRRFTQKNPAVTFRGLPGVIADCLPDRFGMRVIHEFYKKRYNLDPQEVDPIKLLLYVGDRSMGALEFTPTENVGDDDFLNQDLEVTRLHREAKKVLEGKADEMTAKIMRIGGSAGGARAKALIDFNPKKGLMRSGFSKAKSGFIPAIIKFDGVKEGEEENFYGRLEYIYSLMAKKCGINMPQAYLLEENGRAHFIVERFDRNEKKEKIAHFASLCGLAGLDFYQKHSCSYEELFQYVSYLTNDASQVVEAFKIMVFNIIFRNQDDHTKNFGFLMDQKGKWSFAPAYDLNYVFDAVGADTHQMKMNFKDDGFERHDFIITGKKFGLKERQVNKILDRTLACTEEFLKICEENSLDIDFARGVHRNFRTYLKTDVN